jgi:hypothetical protein
VSECFYSQILTVYMNGVQKILWSQTLVKRTVNWPTEWVLLQSDIDCVHEWCSENSVKLSFSKIRVISFTTDMQNYQYTLGNSLWTDCIKNLVYTLIVNVILSSCSFLFSYAIRLLGLIHANKSTDAIFCFAQI